MHIARMQIAALIAVLFCCSVVFSLDNGQALTPPMGWNSWNSFGLYPSDQLIRQTADAMVSSGMKDAGYQYVCIDDGWMAVENDRWKRDARGGLVPKNSFPNMRDLTKYVHSKGLKIGLYLACYPCLNHEQQDADSLVAWGFDFLKYDFCGEDLEKKVLMRDCLRNAVRKARAAGNTDQEEIVYSLSLHWDKQWLYGDTVANMWRTYNDIDPAGKWASMLANADANEPHYAYAGPGGWNDADMLVVGKNMSESEDRVHFSLWCIMASPLIAGNDIRNMTAATKAILTNREAIAINQDSLGRQGRRIKRSGNLEVWAKELRYGDLALCFVNRGTTASDISITWGEIASGLGITLPSTKSFIARDIWKAQDLGSLSGSYTARAVPGHDVTLLRLSSGTTASGRNKTVAPKSSIPARFVDGKTLIVNAAFERADVEILDVRGAVIFTHTGTTQGLIADMSGNGRGVYFAHVRTEYRRGVIRMAVK